MRVTRLGLLAISFSFGWLAACAVPEAQRRLRSDVDAAMSRSDGAAAAKRYLEYRRAGAPDGSDDGQALRALALGDLRDALRAADAHARLAAIRAAERFDEGTLFEPVTRLLGDDDEVVRAAAAAAVLRGHSDAPAVLTAGLRSPNAEARVIAVTALGKKVGALAADDLRAALADPEADVREAAVVSLSPVADDADRARFVLLATRDPSGPVRARAVAALGPAAIETARAALADPYLGARLAAVDAVRRILGPEAARPILAPLATGPDLVVALHAAGPDSLAAAIRAAAAAADPAVRAAAANRVTDVRTADVLDTLAADADPPVALAAARALARIGRTEDARVRFAAALGPGDLRLRLDAAGDLARLGDPRGDDALAALAADPDASLRAAAAAAFPDRHPLPLALIALFGDDSRLVRVAAAAAVLARIR